MALRTLGTNATTTLNAFVQGTNMLIADAASIAQNIKDDKVNTHPIWRGAFEMPLGGPAALFIPNRGVLQVLPGDYVAYDPNGWPILVSAYSIATGGWTHT